MKPKQKIALVFSTIAMLAMLLHGILPHHHHDSATEICNTELAQCSHHESTDHSSDVSFSQVNCCETHSSPPTHTHLHHQCNRIETHFDHFSRGFQVFLLQLQLTEIQDSAISGF